MLPTLVPFGKYLVSMLLPALFTITSTVFYVRRDWRFEVAPPLPQHRLGGR